MKKLAVGLVVWFLATGVGLAAEKVKVASAKRPANRPAAAQPVSTEHVSSQFDSFCQEWMQKLAARERQNRSAIHWQPGPDGVSGQYTGYSPDGHCEMKEQVDPTAVPIGKIVYRELTYNQRGASTSVAESSAPKVVDQIEVTEIFRYSKGQWIY